MMLNRWSMLDIDDVENARDGRNKYGLNKKLGKRLVSPSSFVLSCRTHNAASSMSLLLLLAPLLALHVWTRAHALTASTSVQVTGLVTWFNGRKVENIDK